MTSGESTHPEPSAPRQKRPLIVLVGISTAMLISVLAIVLLFYKWSMTEEYTTMIVVWAPRQWGGASVTVTGESLPTPLSGELPVEDSPIMRFHVPEGGYRVRVEKDGKILAQNMTAQSLSRNMIWWPFRTPSTTTNPSAK